jgi:predicted methyltransferase
LKTTTALALAALWLAAISWGAPGGPVPCKPAEAGKKDQGAALKKLFAHLGLTEGSVVADIGAGSGSASWTFAKLVGKSGTVYAEEIEGGKVKSLNKQAKEKGLTQVQAILGTDADPCLPPQSVDLAFLRYVYHHMTKPRPMLRGIWHALKPGGRLVVIDRERGSLRSWVAPEVRGGKHFWTAETTVVRQAREEGFTFVGCAEEVWTAGQDFVLVFQRPREMKEPGRDPDTFVPLPESASGLLLSPACRYQRPVFVAIGAARTLMAPILQHSTGRGLEIVLEEWATQKDERGSLPMGVAIPSVLTKDGDPCLGPEPTDAIFFLDSYHLLFQAPVLLSKLSERLVPAGCIFVLDREAGAPLSRREASHRKKITKEMVLQEMKKAGFALRRDAPRPAPDRFLLVFEKAHPQHTGLGSIPPVRRASVLARPSP